MRLRDCRKSARRHAARAVIISDGCRDYVVEVHQENGTGILTDHRGRTLRFSSLANAKHAVRWAAQVELAVRVAADEACAGDTATAPGFSHLPLNRRAA